MQLLKYEIIIYWSDVDDLYVAEVPDLPGCTAHGDSYDEAVQSLQEAMSLWLDVAASSETKFRSLSAINSRLREGAISCA